MLKTLINISRWFGLLNKTIISMFRIIVLSKNSQSFRGQNSKKERVVILGNGPSFKKTIDENKKMFLENELICLNHFAITDYYSELKPKYYFAIAHDLFLDNAELEFIDASNKLFHAIAKKTTWKLKFYISFEAKSQMRWQEILKQNENVEIIYMNLTPIEGFERFSHRVFKKGLGMPRPHNVMIPSIFSAINLGVKEIILIGADHSWLKELVVNENNFVMFHDKHFYDEKSQLKKFNFDENNYPKLHDILVSLSKAFASYHILNSYALKQGVEILNCTPNSYIDAFIRCEIKDNKVCNDKGK